MFQVRRCSVPVLLFSFTMFAVALSARAQPTRTNDSWLDRPLVNWNRRYGNLPRHGGSAFLNRVRGGGGLNENNTGRCEWLVSVQASGRAVVPI